MPPPIAAYVKKLREDRNWIQKDAANLLGYEQSYISAVENGHKSIRNTGLVANIIEKYKLNETEKFEIRRLLEMSARERTIPHNASEHEYLIFNRLSIAVTNKSLDPKVAEAILNMLDISDQIKNIKKQR